MLTGDIIETSTDENIHRIIQSKHELGSSCGQFSLAAFFHLLFSSSLFYKALEKSTQCSNEDKIMGKEIRDILPTNSAFMDIQLPKMDNISSSENLSSQLIRVMDNFNKSMPY